MKWILIIAIIAGQGPAITTAEFNSKSACESASREFRAVFENILRGTAIVCVAKGTDRE